MENAAEFFWEKRNSSLSSKAYFQAKDSKSNTFGDRHLMS